MNHFNYGYKYIQLLQQIHSSGIGTSFIRKDSAHLPFQRDRPFLVCGKKQSQWKLEEICYPRWNSTLSCEKTATHCRKIIFSFHSLLSNEGVHSFCSLRGTLLWSTFCLPNSYILHRTIKKKNAKYKGNFSMSWPALDIYHFGEGRGEEQN